MDKWITQNRPEFHLKVVKEIGEIINSAKGLNTIFNQVVDHLAQELNFDVVSVYLYNAQTNQLTMTANRGLSYDPASPIRMSPEEGLTGLVFKEKTSMSVIPASGHPRYKYFPDSGEWEFETFIGSPIMQGSRCLGVLVGQFRDERQIFSSCETLFEIIASRLSGVLEVAGRLESITSKSKSPLDISFRRGVGVSTGIAHGPAQITGQIFTRLNCDLLEFRDLKEESIRLSVAYAQVEKELNSLLKYLQSDNKLSVGEIGIFKTQLQLLNDEMFRGAVQEALESSNKSAECAISVAVMNLRETLGQNAPDFFKERLNDISELGEKLVLSLLEGRGEDIPEIDFQKGAILVAHDIGPAKMISISKSEVAGIVTEIGGEAGHMAIIARSLGIPVVSGIENVETHIKGGEYLLVDGRTGFVFLNPSDVLIKEYDSYRQKQLEIRKNIQKEGRDFIGAPFKVRVTANIGFPGDIQAAKEALLDDVGLFRTEFSFMQRSDWPTVEDQMRMYEEVAENFEGYITLRTLDIGSDKQLPYYDLPREENPLLGMRSIRFSMDNLEIFRNQILAVVKIMQEGYPFRILLPMITQLWEVESAREVLESVCDELGIHRNERPALGMMLEVPGVLWQLDDYMERVDFMSLGTNDLVQYLLTVDRNSSSVKHLYCEHHPVVVRFLDEVLKRTKAKECDMTVCGEMAGTPVGLLILLALGYTKFSVLPERAFLVRYISKKVTLEQLAQIREFILAEQHANHILTFLDAELEKINPDLLTID
jgi:phosphotransferase system enzyme I (PtsP)